MQFNVNKNEALLRLIVRAIQKGIGEDIREFMRSNEMATYNSLRIMRSDKINTNLLNSVAFGPVELKYFKRYGWTGTLLIDRENLITITICTERTLRSIPAKPDRNIPHYLQTILYVQNSKVKAAQMEMADFIPEMEQMSWFTDDVYRDDYKRIMDDDISFDDGYTHYCITYETERGEIKSIAMRLLDKNFQNAEVYSLNAFLQPDFGELTSEPEQPKKKDAHSLITVKAGIKSEDMFETPEEPAIAAKILKEQRQA